MKKIHLFISNWVECRIYIHKFAQQHNYKLLMFSCISGRLRHDILYKM